MEVVAFGTMLVPCYYMLHRMFAHKFEDRPVMAKSELNSGDIIMFSHNMTRMSHNIVNIEYSHMGMVYRCPRTGRLFIMELTTEGDNPLSTNKPGLYDFDWRADKYNGYVCIRRLKSDYTSLLTEESLIRSYEALKDIDFDFSFTGNFFKKNVVGISRDLDNDYCCSEFVYLMAVQLGLVEFDSDELQDSFRKLATDYEDIWDEPIDLES